LDRDHELSAVLADDTRYRIYRAIAEQSGAEVTVADVARRFHLHPNVARMHLSKLEQAGFLATDLRKTGGGGRPARLYRLSDRVLTFGFPPRRYELLARLALQAVAEDGSIEKACRAAHEVGIAEGRRLVVGRRRPPQTRDEIAAVVRAVAEEQGMLPDLAWHEDGLHITVRNCVFRELSGADPDLVCGMHRSFICGLVEVVMATCGPVSFSAAETSISRGADCCELLCTPARPVGEGERA